MKKEIIHNIDDLKISVFAELDRIYRQYMEKYATLKAEIMEVKRIKDELEMDINRRNTYAIPSHELSRGNKDGSWSSSNLNIMKTMQKNNFDIKKYQMLGYISELQKEKILPLSELTNELVILSQYENGYYQHKDFQAISANLIEEVKAHLRDIYDRKYQFIREPEQVCMKDEEPILNGIYE